MASHQLWALVHGLASLELRGVFGNEQDAEAIWRNSIRAFAYGLFRRA